MEINVFAFIVLTCLLLTSEATYKYTHYSNIRYYLSNTLLPPYTIYGFIQYIKFKFAEVKQKYAHLFIHVCKYQ